MNPKTQSKTLVVGHQNPDTDSIVSALVYAQLRNQLEGSDRFEGVTLGPPNKQSRWLLKQAKVNPPRQIENIELRVGDLANAQAPSISVDKPLGTALALIARHGASTIPVLSSSGQLEGILSDRIPECNYFHQFNTEEFLGILFTLEDLVQTFHLEAWQDSNCPADGKLSLDAYTSAKGDIVLSGTAPGALDTAAENEAAAVILCTSQPRSDWEEHIARHPGLGVFRYPGSLMALASQLSHCIPARNAMTSQFTFLHPNQPISDVRNQIQSSPYALPVVDSQGGFVGLISRAELLEGTKPNVILVDHFETNQTVPGLEEAEIVEIIDHHRVGNLETQFPIKVDCQPVGSTATIIAQRFQANQIYPSLAQSTLLLGAIISDTLALNSPTTTDQDRDTAHFLAEQANVDLNLFAMQVLVQADSTLTDPPANLINQDLKEFGINKVRFSVSQIETVDRSKIPDSKIDDFTEALQQTRKERALDFSCLLITDVLQKSSLVIVADPDERRRAQITCSKETRPQIWEGCVSRKSQYLPTLLKRLSNSQP